MNFNQLSKEEPKEKLHSPIIDNTRLVPKIYGINGLSKKFDTFESNEVYSIVIPPTLKLSLFPWVSSIGDILGLRINYSILLFIQRIKDDFVIDQVDYMINLGGTVRA